MEYLMTYGWAILILAVVLGAFYSLGVFNGTNFTTSTCIADVGFLCNNLVLSANVNNAYSDPSIILGAGVTSPTPWSNVWFVVVPQGQMLSGTSISDYSSTNSIGYWGGLWGHAYFISSLTSGQTATVQMYINPNFPGATTQSIKIQTKLTGSVWAMYSTPTTTNALTEIAKFNAVATTSS